MGITRVTASVIDFLKTGTPYEADFLVDTGSTDCLVAGDKLVAAGVAPEGKSVNELANGQPIEMEFGYARIRFFGEETMSKVIFGPKDVEPILGVLALESVGVVVDPNTQTLRRLPPKPLKFARW